MVDPSPPVPMTAVITGGDLPASRGSTAAVRSIALRGSPSDVLDGQWAGPVALWVRSLPDFDQVAIRIADVAADFVLVLFRRRQEIGPLALHSAYTAAMSLTRILRKLLTRSGSAASPV